MGGDYQSHRTAEPASQNIAERLNACEANLRKHHRLALAGTLIGATMHEVNNRLAALTNYIYLARTAVHSPGGNG
jgi:phosphoglycerate-specific signal transduction histidine kinase